MQRKERKIPEQTEMEYLHFLDSNVPDDFPNRRNTGRYVEGNPGGFYLTVERNGYLGNNQRGELNRMMDQCSEEGNIVAFMERGHFKPIQRVNGELNGQDMHVLMGIAGPTAKQYGAPILLYIMGLESSGPRGNM